MPPYLFPTRFENVGTMRNSGFEFDITWNAVKTKDFSYTLNIVGATMSNKFVHFSNGEYTKATYDYRVSTQDPTHSIPYNVLKKVDVLVASICGSMQALTHKVVG